MIKKITFLFLFLSIIIVACAQQPKSEEKIEPPAYKYERIVEKDSAYPQKAVVIFSFINGNEQHAITYRQEKIDSYIEWIETAKGVVEQERIVEKITANLSPHEEIRWKFIFQHKDTNQVLHVEKAALLIMNEQFEVAKTIFNEEKVK